ncbi:hypothetical protein LR48_Vigan02g088500 [Vigna angularis]|uniref:Uncharacterized protein n=1 Tax=Phaseolus angularis TaxID=3914 RepID=A0A0L9TW07_PHAAN|nr:hypothetical protein LR48_Vigan02g088500 [Vigna angularis]
MIKKKIVQQDLECDDEEFKPGKPVKYRNKLWIVMEIKVNVVIEIKAPYSRRVKKDDFMTHVAWPTNPAQASGGARASRAAAMEEDDDDEEEDEDEDEEEDEEEDDDERCDDSRG